MLQIHMKKEVKFLILSWLNESPCLQSSFYVRFSYERYSHFHAIFDFITNIISTGDKSCCDVSNRNVYNNCWSVYAFCCDWVRIYISDG